MKLKKWVALATAAFVVSFVDTETLHAVIDRHIAAAVAISRNHRSRGRGQGRVRRSS